MIKAIILCHPQSKDMITKKAFKSSLVEPIRMACGVTKPKNFDFHESGDFFPSYASWNAALFETSVILTTWEHADYLIGDNHVAFMHTDLLINKSPKETWQNIQESLSEYPNKPVGLTVNIAYKGMFNDWLAPNNAPFDYHHDPMRIHAFDNEIFVWDYIKKYDRDAYEYAVETNPKMIYSHQFACTRKMFDILGNKIYSVASKLKLSDIGFWTPHMFERLIALYLSQLGEPVLTTAFWHYSSSGTHGPGDLNLYGPRAFKSYKVNSRWNTIKEDNHALKTEMRPRRIQRS